MSTAYATRNAKPATEKQVAYVTSLFEQYVALQQQVVEGDEAILSYTTKLHEQKLATLTMSNASEVISSTKYAIDNYRRLARDLNKPVVASLEAGIYQVGETVYKVQLSKEGNPYAKKLVLEGTEESDGEKYVGRFEYAPGAIKSIKTEDRISLAEAAEFGQGFSCCINCGCALTNKVSVAAGIGPVCAGRI